MLKTEQQRTEAVLFDLDGTLVDSACCMSRIANLLRARYDLPPLPLPELRVSALLNTEKLLQLVLPIQAAQDYKTIHRQYLKLYHQVVHQETPLFEGIGELIADIEKQGIRWGVVTGKTRILVHKICQALPALANMECLVCVEDTAMPKPSAEPILLGLRLLHITSKDCWYVGDQPTDVMAAHQAGIHAIAANWTYPTVHQHPDWSSYHPEVILDTVAELRAVLL